MLLDFQVENFRSYHSPKLFSLVASRQEELPDNVMDAKDFGLRVLKSAAIYGANASGKSNLFKAIKALGDMMRIGPDALRRERGAWPAVFALSSVASGEPTRFEINFLAGREKGAEDRYEYHIGVHRGQVIEEWLNAYPAGGKRQAWFLRTPAIGVPANIKFSKSLTGGHKSLRSVTPPDSPFLYVAEKFGHEQLSIPAQWIKKNCYDRLENSEGATAELCHQDSMFTTWVSGLMGHADLGILGVQINKAKLPLDEELISRLPFHLRRMLEHEVLFAHQTSSGTPVLLKSDVESEGTRRLFDLLAPLGLALREGNLALVDEMSASMHPMLTQRLIQAFHDPKVNTKGAQLVLTTHDVSLLRDDLFRRLTFSHIMSPQP